GRGHAYPTGEVPLAVYKKLSALLSEPGQPHASGAIQPCDLCVYEAERAGTMNLFVPGEQRVYVAPELFLHYLTLTSTGRPRSSAAPSWPAPAWGHPSTARPCSPPAARAF